jgi:hypothetical protein
VRRLADGLELPLHSVALAAHAKVLAALAGEQDVVTGYAPGPVGGRCPARSRPKPAPGWSLLQDTTRVESDLLRHRDFAVDELKRELRRGRAGVRDRVRPDRQASTPAARSAPISPRTPCSGWRSRCPAAGSR